MVVRNFARQRPLIVAACLGTLLLGGLGLARAEMSRSASTPSQAAGLPRANTSRPGPALAPAGAKALAPMPVVSRSKSEGTTGAGLTWFLLCLALFLAINGVALVTIVHHRLHGPGRRPTWFHKGPSASGQFHHLRSAR